jgi:hypothetical protein
VISQHASFTTSSVVVAKKAGRTAGSAGYMIRAGSGVAADAAFHVSDGTNQPSSSVTTRPTGQLIMQTLVANRTLDQVQAHLGTDPGLAVKDATTGSSASSTAFTIGCDGSSAEFCAMDVIAVLVYAKALTAWEIDALAVYYTDASTTLAYQYPALATFSSDTAWTWWNRPRAVELNGALYASSVSSVDVGVRYVSSTGVEWALRCGTSPEEDHNHPAIHVRTGDPIATVWTMHNADNYIRFRRTIAAPSPSGLPPFGPEGKIHFGGTTSYCVSHIDASDVLWFMCRVSDRYWTIASCANWQDPSVPMEWSVPVTLFDRGSSGQLYMASNLAPDGYTMHVGIAHDPDSSSATPSPYYATVNLSTGAIVSGGSTLANLFTMTSPVAITSLEVIESLTEPDSVWVVDVGTDPSGRPTVAYVVMDSTNSTTAASSGMFRYATKDSGTWTAYDVVACGGTLAPFYYGGIQLSPDAQTVYVTRKSGSDWVLDRMVTADRGATWSTTNLVTSSTGNSVRMWPVEGGSTWEAVYVNYSAWSDYNSWTGGLQRILA